MDSRDVTYSWPTRLIHIGLATFGIAAYFTAEGAEDGGDSFGYLLHAYLGLSVATFVLLRLMRGFAGPAQMRFSSWSPFSARQWRRAAEDLKSMFRLKIPERELHEGFAGLVQAFGLLIFTWMAATGTMIFLTGGVSETELFEALEELHEVGENLVPLYLILHVGGVLFHTLLGTHIWRRMFAVGTSTDDRQPME